MAKELPYFKFEPAEWLAGRIAMESFNYQGAFINLCCVYWQKLGDIKIEDARLRLGDDVYEYLLRRKYLSEDNDSVKIIWLDSQLKERQAISRVRSELGKRGAKAKQKLSNSQASAKQVVSRREEKRIEENKKNVPQKKSVGGDLNNFSNPKRKPADYDEFIEYAKTVYGFDLDNWSMKVYNLYSYLTENNWATKGGNDPITDWRKYLTSRIQAWRDERRKNHERMNPKTIDTSSLNFIPDPSPEEIQKYKKQGYKFG